MMSNRAEQFSQIIAGFLGGGRCFLLAKGRVGLYVGLRALQLPRGAKVLIPGYTCMVVPSAVQFAGLEPIYADIDPMTYNLDPERLDVAARNGVAALIVQHTYGIPCNMVRLLQWAASRGIPIIEDCCHAFGSRYQGRLCGTFGSFAFMSGQWNKPFSTGLGGMLLIHDAALADRVAEIIDTEGRAPGFLKNLILHAQIGAYLALVRPSTAMWLTSLYRICNKCGLAIGSSSHGELKGEMPSRYLTTMSPCQKRQGLREMDRIEENIQHRKHMVAFYQAALPRIGLTPLPSDVADGLPLLRYPVRVANKQELLGLADRARVELGSWFEVPLHPAGTEMEAFGYYKGMCPEAEAASREVINLPTHRKVNSTAVERTIEFLRKHARPKLRP